MWGVSVGVWECGKRTTRRRRAVGASLMQPKGFTDQLAVVLSRGSNLCARVDRLCTRPNSQITDGGGDGGGGGGGSGR